MAPATTEVIVGAPGATVAAGVTEVLLEEAVPVPALLVPVTEQV
jgi:hypothetical protein